MFIHIVGTRPNLTKAAALCRLMKDQDIEYEIIHTGQHYDPKLSDVFFVDLGIDYPKWNLEVGSSHASDQTAKILQRLDEVLPPLKDKISAIIVYGDVNSSLAGGLYAKQNGYHLIHIEAGSRSGDLSMPEEFNRIQIDHMSDLNFCIDRESFHNLENEGLQGCPVGNIAMDSFHYIKNQLDFTKDCDPFYLMTLHRPFNVDDPVKLNRILRAVDSSNLKWVFPVHPRTRSNIHGSFNNISFVEPFRYRDFIEKLGYCFGILTDSGGVQCEAASFKKRTWTLRPTTEHQITVNLGWNQLVSIDDLESGVLNQNNPIIENPIHLIDANFYWDGNVSNRILSRIQQKFGYNEDKEKV